MPSAILAVLAVTVLAGWNLYAQGEGLWLGAEVLVAPSCYTPLDTSPSQEAGGAGASFEAAVGAAEEGDGQRALALAASALHQHPGHAAARTSLGFVLRDGVWRTPFEDRQHGRGHSWNARYGWVRPGDVPKYDAGQRPLGSRWITTEADAARRATIDKGWQIRTDHFLVTTNRSLEAGARLAAELEGLRRVWAQFFAGYWQTPSRLARQFRNERAPTRSGSPMRVYYHRDRAQYVRRLRRRQPRVGETLGIYFYDTREAHFFHDDDPKQASRRRATLFHEATHQLFSETAPGRVGAGRDANFWLVEGVACYMELLAPAAGGARYTFGDPAQGRLPSAVVRGPALPLAELSALGQDPFQSLEDLPKVYAQATGVVAMLRHGEHAETDRAALDATLRDVYSGRADAGTLARHVGRSYAELDEQYRQFLSNLSPEAAIR